jgi:hypothetical protein
VLNPWFSVTPGSGSEDEFWYCGGSIISDRYH